MFFQRSRACVLCLVHGFKGFLLGLFAFFPLVMISIIIVFHNLPLFLSVIFSFIFYVVVVVLFVLFWIKCCFYGLFFQRIQMPQLAIYYSPFFCCSSLFPLHFIKNLSCLRFPVKIFPVFFPCDQFSTYLLLLFVAFWRTAVLDTGKINLFQEICVFFGSSLWFTQRIFFEHFLIYYFLIEALLKTYQVTCDEIEWFIFQNVYLLVLYVIAIEWKTLLDYHC